MDFFLALIEIMMVNIVLSGDNAVVIALAARNLPPHLQKKAIVWGTVGAIVVRSVMTVGVVWLPVAAVPEPELLPNAELPKPLLLPEDVLWLPLLWPVRMPFRVLARRTASAFRR